MKYLDRIVVTVFVLCLILSSVLIPVNIIITRDVYYKNQFEKCGIFADEGQTSAIRYVGGDSSKTAEFTNQQLEDIISHITAYFANEKESFALKMDGVIINGQKYDGVDIFGTEAVTHMNDVRQLFSSLKVITTVIAVILALCAGYMIVFKKNVRTIIYKYSLGTVISFFGVFVAFFAFVFVKVLASGSFSLSNYLSELWSAMHHIFFPFDSGKFSGSFFNDTLTQILTLDFFMNTVGTIVINIIALTTAWLVSAKIIFKK